MAATGLYLQTMKIIRISLFLVLGLFSTSSLQAMDFSNEGTITDLNISAGEVKIDDQLYLLAADVDIFNSDAEPEPGLELTVGQEVAFNTDEFERILEIIILQGAPL